jgi:hypothetical protein
MPTMTMTARIPRNGARLLLLSSAPFPLAIALTFLFILTIGTRFPRDVAPGSSLILPGFVLSGIVMALITALVRRHWPEPALRRFSLFLCGITSLMAWPVWTTGILPSVNGAILGPRQTSAMRLTGLSISHASKGRRIYYWAAMRPPPDTASALGAGRYFVPQQVYEAWQPQVGRDVRVDHATGLLGAETVLNFH